MEICFYWCKLTVKMMYGRLGTDVNWWSFTVSHRSLQSCQQSDSQLRDIRRPRPAGDPAGRTSRQSSSQKQDQISFPQQQRPHPPSLCLYIRYKSSHSWFALYSPLFLAWPDLHSVFLCDAGVADQLQTNYASDLRSILKTLFEVMATKCEEGDNDKQKKGQKGVFWLWDIFSVTIFCFLSLTD